MTYEVSDADRAAAAQFAEFHYNPLWNAEIAALIAEGKRDRTDIVQFFAAHRIATEKTVREECAKVADYRYKRAMQAASYGNKFKDEHEAEASASKEIAAAIRAGGGEG